MARMWAAIALLLAVGCAGDKPAGPVSKLKESSPSATAPATAPASPASPAQVKAEPQPVDPKPRSAAIEFKPAARDVRKVVRAEDPPLLIRPQVNLTVVQFRVPAGAVSRNEAFWKRVQENAVGVAAHDVLQKNGIRVGRAPISEYEHITTTVDQTQIQPQPVTLVAAGTKTIDLPVKRGVDYQIIYDFDARNNMTMRSYDSCDNIFVLEFQPAPRKPGDVFVKVCPMVRGLRKHLVPIGDTEVREFEYVSPEKYFDLNLKTELPADSFLIIGPSPEALSPMSLGSTFLVHDGATEKYETVLLIIPQIIVPKAAKPAEAAARGQVHQDGAERMGVSR